MPPTLELPAELTLTPAMRLILGRMFAGYSRVVIKSEFSAGLSETRVLLVRPISADGLPELPLVVKMGPAHLIAHEWYAFQTFIQGKLPRVAEIREPPTQPPLSDWAGLRYRLAGDGVFELESLASYWQHAPLNDLLFIIEEQLFRSLSPLWRHSITQSDFFLWRSYDPLLPVNLLLRPTTTPATTTLSPDHLMSGQLQIGDIVTVTEFVVTEITGETVTLNLPHGNASHRLRIEGLTNITEYEVSQPMPDTVAQVIATRFTMLQTFAQAALGTTVNLTADRLPLPNGTDLPNPLRLLLSILSTPLDVRLARLHGDLNLENILVEHYRGNRNIYLIDFANARQDHVLHDLLRLESEIITKQVAPALAHAHLPPEIITLFYTRLHCTLTQTLTATSPIIALSKEWALLLSLRLMAASLLFEPRQWAEYYHGLTLYLLGTLKFKNLDSIPYAKATAFWGAATLQQLLQAAPPCDDEASQTNVISPSAPRAAPQLGQPFGPYQLLNKIGQGGMATVYQAYQASLDRYVALKLLPQPQATSLERFQQEAKAIANLHHPNILPVYDFGQAEGYNYIAMRYIADGRTLKTAMAQPQSLPQIARFINQIAAALDHAHQQGIIHRDIKPANILLDGDWALLSDFGLAKWVESPVHLTDTGLSVGTPAYMSPEQGQGKAVDHRTDIYALGLILFEMLTGKIPHHANTPVAILYKRSHEPPPSPRTLNPTIPLTVEQVVIKALAINPEQRFQRAGDLAQALQQAINPENIKTQASPPLAFMPQAHETLPTAVGNSQTQRNRLTMLKLVHDFWVKGVLENSLHGLVLLELGMETRQTAVEQPWELVLQTADQPPRPLPPGTSIDTIFNDMNQALLILGEPGGGKTTLLLDLARARIALAEQDSSQPMPVVFNLSSWGAGKTPPSLETWLLEEFKRKYNIPPKVAQPWLENEQLLLMLDGLDEVDSRKREACVQAINAFRQNHLTPMVVSCRLSDYEALSAPLNLYNAIRLQPLTLAQISRYLESAGDELAAVRDLIENDSTWQELAQSPLMLSILTIAYRGQTPQELEILTDPTQRQHHLFTTYVSQMFKRRGLSAQYTVAQTIQWLTWLARQMQSHNQTVFQIEQLQPSWLMSSWQKWLYGVTSRAVGALLGGLAVALPNSWSEGGMVGLKLMATWLSTGIIMGLADTSQWQQHDPLLERLSPRWRTTVNVLARGLLFDLIFVLFFGLNLTLVDGAVFGLIFGLIFGLRGSHQSLATDVQTVETLSFSRKAALKGASLGIVEGFGFGLIFMLFWQIAVPMYGLNLLGMSGLISALFALIGGLISGVFSGLNSSHIPTKTRPNQGIHVSLRNAALTSILVSLLFGLPGGVLSGLLYLTGFGTWLAWGQVGLNMALVGGVMAALWYGGLDVVQHYILRGLLWWQGYLPFRLGHFLDYAVHYVFLRRVGGGYIFVHRLLLDYFAGLGEEK